MTHVVSSALNAQYNLDISHRRLRECLAPAGYEHNADKSHVCPSFVGPGAHGYSQALRGGT
eukprot:7789144-Pyramimonas_sp.AAC.1